MVVNNPNHQPNIEAARELLSPYLDGQVTTEERALVEAGLAASAELRDDLATLRQTVALLAELSPVTAPRPFTLTAAHGPAVGPASRRIWGLPTWLAGWAMVAASLLCVLAIGGTLFTLQFQGAGAPAQIARLEEPAVQEAAAPQAASLATAEEPAAAAAAEPSPTEPAEAPEEKMMLAESAEEDAAPTESLALEEDVVVEEVREPAADEATEDMVASAGESDRVAEGQMQLESSAAESAPDEREAAGAAPVPTPSPLPTMGASESPAVQEEAMPAEAPAEEVPPALAEEPVSPLPLVAAEEQSAAEQNLAAPAEEPQPSQDEFRATVEPQPTTPPTPTVAPTVVAQVTVTAGPAPVPPSPTPTAALDQTGSARSRTLLIFIAGLLVVSGLVLLGLGIWLRRQKQQN